MSDRSVDADLKAIKGFVEFWTKFHHIYSDIFSRGTITKEDELKYLETRLSIKAKYEELKSAMEFRYAQHGRFTDPVNDVLAVENIRFISEANLRKMNNDWKDSYVFLNSILERVKEKRDRLEDLRPVGAFFRRIFKGK